MMLLVLQGKKDPEEKRKTIGGGFIDVFREFATTLKTKHGIKPKFLVQVQRSQTVKHVAGCYLHLLLSMCAVL